MASLIHLAPQCGRCHFCKQPAHLFAEDLVSFPCAGVLGAPWYQPLPAIDHEVEVIPCNPHSSLLAFTPILGHFSKGDWTPHLSKEDMPGVPLLPSPVRLRTCRAILNYPPLLEIDCSCWDLMKFKVPKEERARGLVLSSSNGMPLKLKKPGIGGSGTMVEYLVANRTLFLFFHFFTYHCEFD